jgi:hypothetical protein
MAGGATLACALAMLPGAAIPAHAAGGCLFELTPPPPPYYVLGSLVVPQSSSLAVADCDKTLDEVKADIARRAEAQAEARAAAGAMQAVGGGSTGGLRFSSCTAAHLAGYWGIRRGSAGYAAHLDPDRDGIACER